MVSGQRLREARKRANLTQQELANIMELKQLKFHSMNLTKEHLVGQYLINY